MAARPVWRVARGAVVGLVAGGLTAAGHLFAGGHAHLLPLALLTLLMIAGAIAIGGREWGLLRLFGVLSVSQLLAHLALAGTSSTSHAHLAASSLTPGRIRSGSGPLLLDTAAMPAMAQTGMASGSVPLPGASSGAAFLGGLDLMMFAAHLAAAAVLAALLRWGEDACWRLLAFLLHRCACRWPPALAVPARPGLPTPSADRRPVRTWQLASISRRGPPVSVRS